jgi:hypothetical protein
VPEADEDLSIRESAACINRKALLAFRWRGPRKFPRAGDRLLHAQCLGRKSAIFRRRILCYDAEAPFLNGSVDVTDRRNNTMTARYMVGTKTEGKTTSVTVEAEDALIAALKAKQTNPAAMIIYVRKHNARGDRRHPHLDVSKDKRASTRQQ